MPTEPEPIPTDPIDLDQTRKIMTVRARALNWVLLTDGIDGQAWLRSDLKAIWSLAVELDGRPWLHLSVSRSNRLPSYSDQRFAKHTFIGDHRFAYSVWAPNDQHVNIHSTVLHLWTPWDAQPMPLPDFTRGLATI